jgi:hypothetical protein
LTGLDAATMEFSELGVGCEACHGPGKLHVTAAGASAIERPTGQTVCERCHFKRYKHTVKFKFSGDFHR